MWNGARGGHLMGHLQRNKVKQVVGQVMLIHSVDSVGLAREIDRQAGRVGKRQPVLIEVNLGGEETKSGMDSAEAEAFAREVGRLPGIELRGWMGIPPYDTDPEKVRPHFRRLREIRDAINRKTGYGLTELSIGMTHDFEVAIEEGATIVRIGKGIFGIRE